MQLIKKNRSEYFGMIHKPLSVFYTVICILFLQMFITSCNSDYTPKPRGYFNIEFPKKQYQVFNEPGFPYSFEYPAYATIARDTSFFGEAPENNWWINVDFPGFAGKIYMSYKEIGKYKLDKLVNDAYNMTNKHSVKAYSIDDSAFVTPHDVHGVFFKVGGDVATANQFFLTDSTRSFLRGALYFNAAPNQDSLAPVNAFLLNDMRHLVNTFQWKK